MERDFYNLAASYAYHLILRHPFIDGNKPIGILAMLTFLSINGLKIRIPENELYSLGMKIATSKIKEKEIVAILKSYSLSAAKS